MIAALGFGGDVALMTENKLLDLEVQNFKRT